MGVIVPAKPSAHIAKLCHRFAIVDVDPGGAARQGFAQAVLGGEIINTGIPCAAVLSDMNGIRDVVLSFHQLFNLLRCFDIFDSRLNIVHDVL